MTPHHIAILEKHKHLYDLWQANKSLPHGLHIALGEINQVYSEHFQCAPQSMSCNACVAEVLNSCYRAYEETKKSNA